MTNPRDKNVNLSKTPSSFELMKEMATNKPPIDTRRGPEKSTNDVRFYCSDPDTWVEDGVVVPQIAWGGISVPLTRANRHFLIAGVPGTGKTLAFRMLAQSIFGMDAKTNLPGNDRGIIYDPKQEFYPILRGIGVGPENLTVLNPFDARCKSWDLAADYSTPAEAYQLAKTIIPCPENHSQPFFPKSAAAILAAVISIFMRKAPGKWDLADVIVACLNETKLTEFIDKDVANPYVSLAKNLFGSPDTKKNLIAELSSHLFEFAPIAASWRKADRCGRRFSVREFLTIPNHICLLGANQTYSEVLQSINQLLLKRLSELTLDHATDGQWEALNRTWLLLDEAREVGKVPGLADFINKGRSRGVCAVLGFQDYAGMKEAFGDNIAHEITATCAHKLFLRLGNESAEWASSTIGKAEIAETHFSYTGGSSFGLSSSTTDFTSSGSSYSFPGGYSRNTQSGTSNTSGFSINFNQSVTSSVQVRETDAVLPSEISHLPGFEEGDGLNGFYCEYTKEGKALVHHVKVDAPVFLGLIADSDEPGDRGYIPCSSEDQDLYRVAAEHP